MVFFVTSVILILIGIYGVMVKRNILKIILSLTIMETGVNIFIISIGYIKGRTAPILNLKSLLEKPSSKVVDPLPQALVLTAIVIGVAVTAMALAIAVRMYSKGKSMNLDKFKELKW